MFFCDVASVSERFFGVLSFSSAYSRLHKCEYWKGCCVRRRFAKKTTKHCRNFRNLILEQHCLSLYSKVCILLFAMKHGLLVHIKPVLFIPSSTVGSCIMASTLLQEPRCMRTFLQRKRLKTTKQISSGNSRWESRIGLLRIQEALCENASRRISIIAQETPSGHN